MRLLVRCPAKINTFLAVGQRDERGWHPLRTIFQAIDLCDELEIEMSDQDAFVSDADWLPAENSVTRAVAAMRTRTDFPPLAIILRKRIPAESGLGGGSSDAAGVLRAIQHLAPNPLAEEGLREVAAAIGADVPFFLIGGRARGEGYGEVLTALSDEEERFMVVAKPAVGCSTPEMYRRLDEISYHWEPFPEEFRLYNDFERVAPEECISLIGHFRASGALKTSLRGSESAVFGFFEDPTSALTGAELLRHEVVADVWVAKTLGRAESLSVNVINVAHAPHPNHV